MAGEGAGGVADGDRAFGEELKGGVLEQGEDVGDVAGEVGAEGHELVLVGHAGEVDEAVAEGDGALAGAADQDVEQFGVAEGEGCLGGFDGGCGAEPPDGDVLALGGGVDGGEGDGG